MIGRRGGRLWSSLTSLGSLGDGADQLCHVWSPLLCVVAALLLLAKTQFGQPMQCWPPEMINDAQLKYADSVCMTAKAWLIHLPDMGLDYKEILHKKHNPAHNWIVAVLLLQAFLLYLPALFWKHICSFTGANTVSVLQIAQRLAHAPVSAGTSHENALRILAGHVKVQCGGRGQLAVLLYMLKKMAMVLMVLLQLIVINPLLSPAFMVYGPVLVSQYLTGTADTTLPDAILCDFEVRSLGNSHRHTLQCAMNINTLSKQMCLLVWCMLLAALLATVVSMLRWAALLLLPAVRTAHINRHLQASGATQSNEDRFAVKRFVEQSLGVGGSLQLGLMSHSSCDLLVTQVVEALWSNFRFSGGQSDQLLVPVGLNFTETPNTRRGTQVANDKVN